MNYSNFQEALEFQETLDKQKNKMEQNSEGLNEGLNKGHAFWRNFKEPLYTTQNALIET